MDIFLLRVFQRQVLLQCKFLMLAANEVNQGLKLKDTDRTFYALQNMLVAGANIAKSLWGGGGKLEAQRKPLRDSIGISDSAQLRNVTMRHNFEHLDERLDRWWKESKQHNHIDLSIGPSDMISGTAEMDKFRHFDPVTTDMIFWGEQFNLQQIVNEVQMILPRLQVEANKPHWN
jgi:hypothetical protein